MDLEYGLLGLEKLPLLEQVHRILHAIEMNYPYKTTDTWKRLSNAQKRKMLEYIRERKLGGKSDSSCLQKDVGSTEKGVDSKESEAGAMEDPFLELMRRQKNRNVQLPSSEEDDDDLIDKSMMKKKWRFECTENFKCACKSVHTSNDEVYKRKLLLPQVKIMMTTFGDSENVCTKSAELIYDTVHAKLSKKFKMIFEQANVKLGVFEDYFPEEMKLFKRWKSFKKSSGKDTDAQHDEDDEDLADELEEFSELGNDGNTFCDDVISIARFRERLGFADDRTDTMDTDKYQDFSSIRRKSSFLMKRGKCFCEWMNIPKKSSKAIIESANFVVFDFVGRIVEQAIKVKCQGRLVVSNTPLLVQDVQSAIIALATAVPVPVTSSTKPRKSTRVVAKVKEPVAKSKKRLKTLR